MARKLQVFGRNNGRDAETISGRFAERRVDAYAERVAKRDAEIVQVNVQQDVRKKLR